MKRIKALIALKIVKIGLWLYDNNTDEHWDDGDKANVKKLWEMHDKFEKQVMG